MSMKRCGMVVTMIASVSGCAAFSPRELAEPTSLTVEKAMEDVGKGFVALRRELEAANTKLGIFACSVDVNFNVAASAEQGGKLVLDASLKPPTNVNVGEPSGVSAHAEQTNASSGSRGNTISIKLVNVACVPKETLGGTNPKDIENVAKIIGSTPPFIFKNE